MSSAASSGKPALRCGLGWHRPEPVARWNDGYYFARCRRCRRDLVRTAYGRWQVPRGFRVVWGSDRPDNAVSAALVPIEEGAEETGGTDLPIQVVLRHLHREEQQIGHPARRARATHIPDFMDDANADTSWRSHRPRHGPLASPSATAELSSLPPPAGGADAEPAAAVRARRPALAAGALALLLVVFLLATGGRGLRPAPTTGDRPAYIVASALSCLAEPHDQAPHMRWLMRGDPVRLHAREGDWAGVSYAGQQCWVPVRALSLERPN